MYFTLLYWSLIRQLKDAHLYCPLLPPPLIEVDSEEQAEIEEILDSYMHYKKLQYLVKWLRYSVSDNEWILASNLGTAKEYMMEFYQKYLLKQLPKNLHREKQRRRQKKKKKKK